MRSKMASKDTNEHIMSVDEIFKTCGAVDDSAKLKVFITKYEELAKMYHNFEHRYNTTKREVSALQTDKNKQILIRSRLENLCRELQKQNKTIKDESLLKIREEEEKRKQVTQEFQKTLNNVTTMMTESNTQNNKLGEENKQMAQRLSSIYEEFKTRENEVDRISKQIDIERQLSEARCAKMKTEFMIEKQTLIAERDGLKEQVNRLTEDLLETTSKCVYLEHEVADLKAQVKRYTGQYQEFETTMSRSDRVFDQCKTEINKMNKQITSLEKEVAEWQIRYHKNVDAIYELQIENTEKAEVIEYITKKQKQLTKLCRQLQAERKAYINTLRELGQNPNDIPIEALEDEPLEDPFTTKPAQIASASGDAQDKHETKVLGKNKSIMKPKKGKQKGKKGKDVPHEYPTPMTLKEIHLAELRQELEKVQSKIIAKMADNSAKEINDQARKQTTKAATKLKDDNLCADAEECEMVKNKESNETVEIDPGVCPVSEIMECSSENLQDLADNNDDMLLDDTCVHSKIIEKDSIIPQYSEESSGGVCSQSSVKKQESLMKEDSSCVYTKENS